MMPELFSKKGFKKTLTDWNNETCDTWIDAHVIENLNCNWHRGRTTKRSELYYRRHILLWKCWFTLIQYRRMLPNFDPFLQYNDRAIRGYKRKIWPQSFQIHGLANPTLRYRNRRPTFPQLSPTIPFRLFLPQPKRIHRSEIAYSNRCTTKYKTKRNCFNWMRNFTLRTLWNHTKSPNV